MGWSVFCGEVYEGEGRKERRLRKKEFGRRVWSGWFGCVG